MNSVNNVCFMMEIHRFLLKIVVSVMKFIDSY